MKPILHKHIVIVDDDPILGNILCTILRSYFPNPKVFSEGRKAIDYLISLDGIPKMILLDYYMPDMSGIEIIEKLNELDAEYPVMILSSTYDISVAVEAMKKGALDFIEKGKLNSERLLLDIEKGFSKYFDKVERKRLQKELEIHEKQLEELLQERTLEIEIAKLELEQFFNLSLNMMVIIDSEGFFRRINKAWEPVLGYSISQLENSSIWHYIHPDDVIKTKNELFSLDNPKYIKNFINRCKRSNGSYRWIEWNAAIYEGKLIYAAGRDITDQKLYEVELELHRNHLEKLVKQRTEALESANQELIYQKNKLEAALENLQKAQVNLVQSEKMASLGILMSGVAHEINNPVNYINSSISGLENVISDVVPVLKNGSTGALKNEEDINKSIERIEKMLKNVKTGVSRTLQIVTSLRMFSRSDEDIIRQTNIQESIDTTLTILYNQYKNRIEILKEYDDIPLVNCYPGKLNQVFMNIIANAIQSIENNGKIVIKTGCYSKNEVYISVVDSGHGIPETLIPKIFDPFFTTKEPGKGTGLGLSIAYDIINQHKGQIKVNSCVGKGTEFVIIIPI